ncbi:hypothetical protein PMAYCL1PPCAC_09853 [Pristionchus mayeri]|uniref:RING-type domain-containing protein n=1 Tax=Pristionchus mayeri TaxID=1317129 RepID=A0AAN4ZJN2_9BILA|nr:hypothetical protein PMAYCL1PPCAC_09853 [Pristionchus mayeri]
MYDIPRLVRRLTTNVYISGTMDVNGQGQDQFLQQFLQQQYAYVRQVQQLVNQPNLQHNDHLMQMHQQLQQIQQIPPVPLPQAQQIPVPQPQPQDLQPQQLQPQELQQNEVQPQQIHAQQLQPQQLQPQQLHAPQLQQQQQLQQPAAPANLAAPQVHVHMMPAGLGFAAIPYYAAPFAAGQYAQPLRRRLALPRRAAPLPPPIPAAAPVAQPVAVGQQPVLPFYAVDINDFMMAAADQQPRGVDLQPEMAGIPMANDAAAVAAGAALAADNQPPPAPDPIHPEQREIQVQLVLGPPHDPPAENGLAAVDRVDDPPHHVGVVLEDPLAVDMRDVLFDDEVFGAMRADFAEDAAERRLAGPAAAGERTPPRDLPVRVEDPDQQEMNVTCPICVLPFKNGADGSRVARVLACGHLICTGCVNQFCRNIRENRVAYRSYERAPCIVCQRSVRWRNLPECKTVGYLYEQVELMNEERKPIDEASKIRTDARKKTYRHLDNVSSVCHEIATKMRKLVRKADGVYDQSLEVSSHSVGRDTMNRIECEEQAEWLVGKAEEESRRVGELEKQFNEQYEKMSQILEEISSNGFSLPKEFPMPQNPSTSS